MQHCKLAAWRGHGMVIGHTVAYSALETWIVVDVLCIPKGLTWIETLELFPLTAAAVHVTLKIGASWVFSPGYSKLWTLPIFPKRMALGRSHCALWQLLFKIVQMSHDLHYLISLWCVESVGQVKWQLKPHEQWLVTHSSFSENPSGFLVCQTSKLFTKKQL